jgi:CheY-like chemotaxis protein
MTMKTVWIADDDPYYHEDMKDYLETKDLETCPFYTATALLDALARSEKAGEGEQRRPGVIVVDMMMPYDDSPEQQTMPPDLSNPEVVTGVRIIRKLKEAGWDMRNTVAITAYDDKPLHRTLQHLGLADWQILLKPAPAKEILRAILRASSAQ